MMFKSLSLALLLALAFNTAKAASMNVVCQTQYERFISMMDNAFVMASTRVFYKNGDQWEANTIVGKAIGQVAPKAKGKIKFVLDLDGHGSERHIYLPADLENYSDETIIKATIMVFEDGVSPQKQTAKCQVFAD